MLYVMSTGNCTALSALPNCNFLSFVYYSFFSCCNSCFYFMFQIFTLFNMHLFFDMFYFNIFNIHKHFFNNSIPIMELMLILPKIIIIIIWIAYRNPMFRKKIQKLSNYKDLQIEVAKCVNLKLQLSFCREKLDIIKNRTENHVSKILGHISISDLQKITLCGTVHIIRKTRSI